MWYPPAPRRHAVPPARWPTAEDAARSRWFSPLDVARLQLAERTWVPAMVPWRVTEDGTVTPGHPRLCKVWERVERAAPGVTVSTDRRRRLTAPASSLVLQTVSQD